MGQSTPSPRLSSWPYKSSLTRTSLIISYDLHSRQPVRLSFLFVRKMARSALQLITRASIASRRRIDILFCSFPTYWIVSDLPTCTPKSTYVEPTTLCASPRATNGRPPFVQDTALTNFKSCTTALRMRPHRFSDL